MAFLVFGMILLGISIGTGYFIMKDLIVAINDVALFPERLT